MGIGLRHIFTAKHRTQAGQMTVELAVALPVMIVVALIAVNALLLMGECASFDRLACEAVRTYAASPGYGVDAHAAAAQACDQLSTSFAHDFEQVEVQVGETSMGHVSYEARLHFYPTLFGRPFSHAVFGVAIPPVTHSVRIVIDAYKPGAII